MLGLAVLFALAVWIIVTILAMVFGYRLGTKIGFSKFGAFTYRIYACYGWLVCLLGIRICLHSTQSNQTLQNRWRNYSLCYPWRVATTDREKEWLEMRQYQTPIEIQNYPKGNFIFNGKEYFPTSIANRRVVKYSGFERINKFTEKTTSLVVDLDQKKILFQYIYYSSGVGGILSKNGHKFWLNSINDCKDDVYDEYQNLITYYSNS